jgi:hypothetical protein
MDSAKIGKIQEVKHYAEETERIVFDEFRVTLTGDYGRHTVGYNKGRWSCDCDFFATHYVCSHTMTLERVLGGMVPQEWQRDEPPSRPSPSVETYLKLVNTWASAFDEEATAYTTEDLESLYDDAYFEALELQRRLP